MTTGHVFFSDLETRYRINPLTDANLGVDVQEAFMPPNGNLAVEGGDEIVEAGIKTALMFSEAMRIATRDLHPPGHVGSARSYVGYEAFYRLTYEEVGRWTEEDNRIAPCAQFTLQELKEYLLLVGEQILWPEHAVEGTEESEIVPGLLRIAAIVRNKGTKPSRDSYSGIQDNGGESTGLDADLAKRGVKRIFVWGLAFDYCVGFTALDAKAMGFEVVVIGDLCRSVTEGRGGLMLARLTAAGIPVISSAQIDPA